jgi:hypothetical protein
VCGGCGWVEGVGMTGDIYTDTVTVVFLVVLIGVLAFGGEE